MKFKLSSIGVLLLYLNCSDENSSRIDYEQKIEHTECSSYKLITTYDKINIKILTYDKIYLQCKEFDETSHDVQFFDKDKNLLDIHNYFSITTFNEENHIYEYKALDNSIDNAYLAIDNHTELNISILKPYRIKKYKSNVYILTDNKKNILNYLSSSLSDFYTSNKNIDDFAFNQDAFITFEDGEIAIFNKSNKNEICPYVNSSNYDLSGEVSLFYHNTNFLIATSIIDNSFVIDKNCKYVRENINISIYDDNFIKTETDNDVIAQSLLNASKHTSKILLIDNNLQGPLIEYSYRQKNIIFDIYDEKIIYTAFEPGNLITDLNITEYEMNIDSFNTINNQKLLDSINPISDVQLSTNHFCMLFTNSDVKCYIRNTKEELQHEVIENKNAKAIAHILNSLYLITNDHKVYITSLGIDKNVKLKFHRIYSKDSQDSIVKLENSYPK